MQLVLTISVTSGKSLSMVLSVFNLRMSCLRQDNLQVCFKFWLYLLTISSVQFRHSVVSAIAWNAGRQAPLSITNSQSCSNSHSLSQWYHPTIYSLLSPSPPAFNLSQYRVFSNESVLCIRWPEYRNFSFSISPFNEYSELISFRIDWFDLFAVQGTLKVFSNTTVQNHQSIPQSINTTVKSINQSKKKMMFYLQYHDWNELSHNRH